MLLFGLFRLIGASHPLRITTVMAAAGISAALGSYVVGRVQGGGRSGRIAAVLLVRRSPRAALECCRWPSSSWWSGGVLPSAMTDLRPGEVERTWAFLYPLLAGTTGLVVDRWTRDGGSRRGVVVAGRRTTPTDNRHEPTSWIVVSSRPTL